MEAGKLLSHQLQSRNAYVVRYIQKQAAFQISRLEKAGLPAM